MGNRLLAALVLATSLVLVPIADHAADALSYTSTSVTIATSTPASGAQQIPATLLRPEGGGRFPAIAIMHDCSGLGARSSGSPLRWGQRLAGQGYVILIPDSFGPRGFPDGVCTAPLDTPAERMRAVSPFQRSFDAYAALAYLRAQPFVDGDHIGVMGGSHGGSTTLGAMVAPASPTGYLAQEKQHGFAAGVALYPGCAETYGAWRAKREFGSYGPATEYLGVYRPIAPLLILIGEKDDWTPAPDCAVLAKRAQEAELPVEIKIYPGADHSFDSGFAPRYIDNRRNINKPERHGATTGGNAAAWQDAIEQVTTFFAAHVKGAAK